MKRALFLGLGLLASNIFSSSPVHADCAAPPDGMVGWWKAEANAKDIVGGACGVLYPGTTFSAGAVGQAFNFDGDIGCVMNTNTPPLTNIQNNFTMEFWAYPRAGFTMMPEGDGTGTSGQSYAIFPNWGGTDGKAGVGVCVGTNGVSVVEHAHNYMPSMLSYPMLINNWVHIAVVYSNKQPTLYLNGVKVRTGIASDRTFVYPSKDFGGSYDSVWGYQFRFYGPYNGLLDEVSVYNRTLSASEIAAIYNAGSSGKCEPSAIIQQPENQTTVAGSSATLTVAMGGAGPFTYQWRFNGVNISSATNSTLTLTNLHVSQSGAYSVAVNTPDGVLTSSAAAITVIAQDILAYNYTGNEKITTAGSEFSYDYSGQMFFIPASTNGMFIGWGRINGKKQYWVSPFSDYLLFTIPGQANHVYTMLGWAGDGIDAGGHPCLWSYLHRGQNTLLPISNKKKFPFPSTFNCNDTHVYPDSQTGNMILREAASTYQFAMLDTQFANNNGQTITDLLNGLTKSLERQGYKKQ